MGSPASSGSPSSTEASGESASECFGCRVGLAAGCQGFAGSLGSTSLQNATPLALRGGTPHAVVDSMLKCVLEALFFDGAGAADLFGGLNPDAIAREEDCGRVVVAVTCGHPRRVHA